MTCHDEVRFGNSYKVELPLRVNGPEVRGGGGWAGGPGPGRKTGGVVLLYTPRTNRLIPKHSPVTYPYSPNLGCINLDNLKQTEQAHSGEQQRLRQQI